MESWVDRWLLVLGWLTAIVTLPLYVWAKYVKPEQDRDKRIREEYEARRYWEERDHAQRATSAREGS